MALKEGRCVNCGSILFLEPKNEKGHCLFCDAVFDNSEAFRAHSEPEEFSFPNEPQPEYDGPNLDPRPSAVSAPAMRPMHKPAVQKKKAPAFVPKVTSIPDAKMPRKAKMATISVILAVLILFAAILVPLLLKRDLQRQSIQESLSPRLAGVDWDKHVSILNLKSDYIIIALEDAVSEEEAESIFDAYSSARSEAIGQDADKRDDGVKMRLVTPDGGYVFDTKDDEYSIKVVE